MVLQNNAGIILTIFAFYTIIFVLLGLLGTSSLSTSAFTAPPTSVTFLGFLTQIGFFFQGIAFSVSGIPVWANLILFFPLGVTVLYIIIEVIAVAIP